jgi:hypothetical protein
MRWVVLLVAVLLSGCAATGQRAARSSVGCMQAVVDALPAGLDEAQSHCVASGWIARQCSVAEAWMAGAGKEVRDLFAAGDASWADWRMDRKGMRCAKGAVDGDAIVRCCANGS